MKLKDRFRLIVGVAAAGLSILAGCWLYSERSRLLAEKQEQAQNLVAIPYSIMAKEHQLQAEGSITAAEAQRRAVEEIQAIRYDGDNYFWINDLHPTMVMHPINPKLNGQDLTDYKDPNGKALFMEMVETVRKDGRGFVSYQWPRPGNGKESPVSKLSFVREFEPWGWIIGTGIYIDDVDAAWRTAATAAAGLGIACLAILLIVSTSVSRSIFGRLENFVKRMKNVTAGKEDFTQGIEPASGDADAVPVSGSDEIGIMIAGFNEMLAHIRARDAQLQSHREHLEEEVSKRTCELSAAHAEIALFLESIPSILIGLDPGGRVTRWNRTASQTFGIGEPDARGRTLDQCGIKWLHPDMSVEVSRWLHTDLVYRCDDLAYEMDEKVRFVGFSARPILFGQGERVGVIVTGMDITERKVLEEQLRQSQKLEAIGQLSAGLSHEINTPAQYIGDNTLFLKSSWERVLKLLNICRTMQQEAAHKGAVSTESLARFDDLSGECDLSYLFEEVPHAIDQSLDGVQRVAKIVRAMKEFSHPGADTKQAVDINHALDATITVAKSEWKSIADLEMRLEPDLPPVPCFASELNQVILNLVLNAAQAIRDVVGDGSHGKGRITITTRREGEWVEISIADTGAGIPSDIRTRVFEPFFTTNPVGKSTGQGLALAHSVVVKKHGGRIWFDTAPGQGTTFFIKIPCMAVAEIVA